MQKLSNISSIPALNSYVPTARLDVFLDGSSMGTTMLTAGNDQKSLLAVVYDSDPGAYMASWVGTSGMGSLNQGLAAMPNLQLSDLIQQAGQFLTYNATTLTSSLLKYQRRYLSSHVLYGSSRLGTKDYLPGQHYLLRDNTGPTAIIDTATLAARAPWYSYGYNEVIPTSATEPWGNSYHGTYAMNHDIGQKQYEISNHLGNVQATISDLKFAFGKYYGEVETYHPALRAAYDYYPFGMLMPDRYVSDTSAQCITVMQPKWLWRWVKIWCKDIYEWQWPIFKEINGGKASVSEGAVSIDLQKPEDGVSFDVPVEAGVQQQFALNIQEEEILGEGASIQVMELQVDGWQPLAQFDLKRGEVLATFTPTVSTVKLLFTGPMAVKVGSWCMYKWEMVQDQVLVDICTDDKDPYRFGFNGMFKDNEMKGIGNSLDFGARMQDSRIGRWFSVDPMAGKYPGYSSYNYVLNTPLSATDPDGKLVMFIGGLRLWIGDRDQPRALGAGTLGGKTGIYNSDAFDYWTSVDNGFGNYFSMSSFFKNRLGDYNAYYTSGSSSWSSQPLERYNDGIKKAKEFHAMVQNGEIKLADDETIKIISHSQGGAYAAGFAAGLLDINKEEGANYKIEVMYYITPHQPKGILHPGGIRGVQYSHPDDGVASHNWIPNGGTEFGKIQNITEFDGRDIFGGEDMPSSGGIFGNRGGHNVNDNSFIKNISKGKDGYVAPRKDKPQNNSGRKSGQAVYSR